MSMFEDHTAGRQRSVIRVRVESTADS